MLTKDELAAIAERESKASAGPWTPGIGFGYQDEVWLDGDCEAIIGDFVGGPCGEYQHIQNAVFCAHARQDIPALLSHIETQAALIEQLRERLDRERRSHGY
jgi:hypothetical protein